MREAKHLAMDSGVSLSRFVAGVLEERIAANRAYRAARERQRHLLKEGVLLGTEGSIVWDRERLHER
jgi:hypothetical protein